jgi:hypothetical protein
VVPGADSNRRVDRSSVSTEQQENLDAILRQGAFPASADVNEQRPLLKALLSAQPLPADVTVTAAALGGVPTAEITIDGIEPRHVVLYFHGGVYVLGDAFQAASWPRRSAGGVGQRSFPSTTGSPPNTRIRRAAGSPSPCWSTPECPCPPLPTSCHRTSTSPWPGQPWDPNARILPAQSASPSNETEDF